MSACCVLLIVTSPGRAQGIGLGGGEYYRAARPGPYVPYDGASFSHRYFYEPGPALFLGLWGRQATYAEYIDRLVRAEKFGYAPPPPPRGLPAFDQLPGQPLPLAGVELPPPTDLPPEVGAKAAAYEEHTLPRQIEPRKTLLGRGLQKFIHGNRR